MEPTFRRAFNAAFTDAMYEEFLHRFEARAGCGPIPFRVAETPFFVPVALRDSLERAASEIVEQISNPAVIERMKGAIPPRFFVPGMDPLPNCVQVDFAIVRGPSGELEGKVVELQAFPSLYALELLHLEVLNEQFQSVPGLERRWSLFFGGLTQERYVEWLKRTILGGEDPEAVVLLDLQPQKQKTYADFVATKEFVGIDSVCPTELLREGRKLFRRGPDGRLIQVRRFYNRVVFDELEVKQVKLPFEYTDDLDVTWCSHPNWYWIWSKYTLPHIDHPAVPKARYVSQIDKLPEDLSKYVLKPLFSFAGTGVRVDVKPEDVEGIPAEQRGSWLLQEKIAYDPGLLMPDGSGVKAELRVMFLRAPDEEKPKPVINLVRLSRGKMHGVDHNRDLTWVGGTIGIWPED
ncbi:MAG: hypothetical protein HUU21_29190 [Polyangiaceae bacterium]|nr:hypothetical protein [Polyangiaceae bacterium]